MQCDKCRRICDCDEKRSYTTKIIVTTKGLYELADDIIELVMEKNHDYADAWQKQGMPGVMSRLADKLCRVDSLLGREALVVSENIEDTLVDAIGYSLLGLLYYRSKENDAKQRHGNQKKA